MQVKQYIIPSEGGSGPIKSMCTTLYLSSGASYSPNSDFVCLVTLHFWHLMHTLAKRTHRSEKLTRKHVDSLEIAMVKELLLLVDCYIFFGAIRPYHKLKMILKCVQSWIKRECIFTEAQNLSHREIQEI
ncbi:hypothetical protein NPIL_316951 [Nephila pilipes]|uniref:Uncharacterized protein n=1 Tax=Nephila pilipes TaxID=299642 RepID=A0A8X6MGN5_NEPPI|nr:hypothetical protein NPIL_316951 [Nephila pilipes]